MRKPKQLKQVYRPDYLLALADYLAAVDNQFDLRSWVKQKDGDDYTSHISKDIIKKLGSNPKWAVHKTCGTKACAMGHAPSVPLLAKAGLTLVLIGGTYLVPKYKGVDGFDAASKLFGISDALAYHFFDPESYEDEGLPLDEPRVVTKRLYEFVADPFNYIQEHSLG